jgi:electron transfer flavoprotein beta subunit
MAMGVDRAVLISDPAFADSDTLATSTTLAAAIRKLHPFDLVLFGTRTADSDTGQVGPQTAVCLDLPMATGARSIELKEKELIVDCLTDGFQEKFKLALPAALTIHSRSVEPRPIGLSGIETAFEDGQVEQWGIAELGLSPEEVGLAGSRTRVASWKRVARKRKCELLSGSMEEKVEKLLHNLTTSGLIE